MEWQLGRQKEAMGGGGRSFKKGFGFGLSLVVGKKGDETADEYHLSSQVTLFFLDLTECVMDQKGPL